MKSLVIGLGMVLAGLVPVAYAGYADERAQIEDLMGRYLFANDWVDADAYADTFTEDGVLVHGKGEAHGKAEIRAFLLQWRASLQAGGQTEGLRPPRTRHSITNLVVKVEGDTARARAYWTMLSNDRADRQPYVKAFGHYEDDLVKVNGQWLFKRREIYNEQLERRAATSRRPTAF